MPTILELSTTAILFAVLVLGSYRKWKFWNNKEERIVENGFELTNAEKKKNYWANILYVNALSVFIPLACFVASTTYEKTTSLASLIGLSVVIKVIDYIAKGFLKSKSIILHLVFLSIIGFSITYLLIVLINYDILTSLIQQ